MSLLVNLATGETIKADHYRLKELGRPEGFRVAEDVTIDEWIEALRAALKDTKP